MTACDLSGGTKPWKCHYRVRKYLLMKIVKLQILKIYKKNSFQIWFQANSFKKATWKRKNSRKSLS